MGILDRIATGAGSAAASFFNGFEGNRRGLLPPGSIDPWMVDQAEAARFRQPSLEITRNQQQLYLQLSWVQSAVRRLSEQAAGGNLEVLQIENEELVGIPSHDFELLLNKPNPAMSRYEFLAALFAYWALVGNAYIWLNKASEEAPPDEMWIIPSDKIRPIPDGKQYIKGYAYKKDTDGQEIFLATSVISHWKNWNPNDVFNGQSPVAALATVSEGDLASQKYARNFYADDNVKFPGVLTFKSMVKQTDWERIKADMKRQAGGVRRGLMMLRGTGDKGVEWVKTAMSQRDMEFLATRESTKEEIWGMFVPGLASWLAINSTEANSKSGKEAFLELAVWPAHQALGQKITNDILPLYGENLLAQFEDVRIKDRMLILEEQKVYMETHTVEETRAKFHSDDPLGDDRDDKFPSEVGGFSSFGDPAEDTSEVRRKEEGQFRRYVERTKKVDGFKFYHLDEDEQAKLKAEFMTMEEQMQRKLEETIDMSREVFV